MTSRIPLPLAIVLFAVYIVAAPVDWAVRRCRFPKRRRDSQKQTPSPFQAAKDDGETQLGEDGLAPPSYFETVYGHVGNLEEKGGGGVRRSRMVEGL